MVNLVYPNLDNLTTPDIAIELKIEAQEWKSLVKIALDYLIRYKFHYSISQNVRGMASNSHKSFPIYQSQSTIAGILKWPDFDRHRNRPNRLSLLICSGLGYHEHNTLDNIVQDRINELMERLWITIVGNFLTADGTEGGYKLDLEEKASFELADKLWLCPVKKRFID
jgi:hypothetical protein